MNAKWSQLSQSQQQAFLTHLDPESLKGIYGLTDDELTQAQSAVEKLAADSRDASHNSSYEDFLRTEYNNIAQAHFQTHTNITQFFQFYLLIVGIPITLIGLIERLPIPVPSPTGSATSTSLVQLLSSGYGYFLAAAALVITVVGLCMMAYIINLRLDALQYARVVNGVRKYFLDKNHIHIKTELSTRVLPRSIHQPRYMEWRFFGWVVATFAWLNTAYMFGGCTVLGVVMQWLDKGNSGP